jgi:hypothetical protein
VQADFFDATGCITLPKGNQIKCRKDSRAAIRSAKATLADHVSPGTFCQSLCGRTVPKAALKAQDWKCPFCEFVTEQAEEALRNKHNDHEILHFMRQECRRLPLSFAGPCVDYVNTEGVTTSSMADCCRTSDSATV